jgi:hypothetical protein
VITIIPEAGLCKIQVGPNPAVDGRFTVTCTELPDFRIQVFNNIGNLIRTYTVNHPEFSIDLSDQPA